MNITEVSTRIFIFIIKRFISFNKEKNTFLTKRRRTGETSRSDEIHGWVNDIAVFVF